MRAAFTLVELLAVVAIVGLLMALTIPAFEGIGRGAKMNSAAIQLRSTISLARQWAITHRESVYIVFPSTNASLSYSSSVRDAAKAYRAYNVYTPANSNYIRDWISLPEGVVFEPGRVTIPTSPKFLNVMNGADVDFLKPVRFPSNSVQNVVCIEFKPDGQAVSSDSTESPFIVLQEGWVDVSTNSTPYASVGLRSTNNIRGVIVNTLSGTIKVVSL